MPPAQRQGGRRRFQWAVIVASTLMVMLLAATGYELRREFASAGALRQEVARSYDTRAQIQAVFSLLQDAETGQRGYIITGDDRFLEPYDRSLAQLDAQMAALSGFFEQEGPEQRADHDRLIRRVVEKRVLMERSIDLRAEGDADAAVAAVAGGAGKAAMDDIRRLVRAMIAREAQSLDQLSARAEARSTQVERLVALLFLALVAAAGVTAFMVWRYLTTRGALMERLTAASARQRATLDSAIDAIITLNPSGSIESLNPAAERMFGWSAAELGRRDIGVLIDLADNGEGPFLQRLGASQGALDGGLLRELVGKRRDGTTLPVDVALGAMDLPTGRHVVAVIRDITERRRVEGMKDAFVSTVSHELRTPLTSIAGSLGLLAGGAGGALPDKAARLITIAHSNSQRLVRLINDILDVEKLQSDQLVLAMAPLDLRDIAARSIDGVRGYADQLGVGLTLTEGVSAPVRGDADRLIQVVTNLLSNAAKFSPTGGAVTVSVNPEARIARLSVVDQGPGIPETFRSRIFGKFAQADSTDSRAKGGTGLGLAIAREIAERHGGRLWFESAEGEGAAFHLDLPLDTLDEQMVRGGPGRLLICEDDPDAAAVLVEMLAQDGYEVDVTGTARDALSLARSGAYAAALIDLQLPDADGVSLIRALKSGSETRALPVVVVSGDVARGKARGRSLEVVDWMEKPFDQDRLRRAVGAIARPSGRPLILHIDDDRDILEVTRQALAPSADVIGVESLAQARAALAMRRPDVVILDLGLPDGHGLDILPELTTEDGGAIPVVIYSAQDMDAQTAPAVHAVLTKSKMSLTQLSRTVRRLTRRRYGDPS